MKHARDMTEKEFKASVSRLLREQETRYQQHEHEKFMAKLRAQNPDLAARADEAALAKHRELLKQVVAAYEALRIAAAENAVAAKDPSPLRRQRAEERLRAAEAEHDALVLKAEASHAALSK